MLTRETKKKESTVVEPTLQERRLKHIRHLYKSYPIVTLPFEYSSHDHGSPSGLFANFGSDTLVFRDAAPCGIIGVLPDTSQFYAFFYLAALDSEAPSIITWDKQGKLIHQKVLVELCWHGCESDCNFFFKIDEKHQMTEKYAYYEYDYDFDKDYCAEMPYAASGYVNTSYLSPQGKVVQLKRDTISFEELMAEPIIHEHE